MDSALRSRLGAFTLVELLVAIAIVAILAALLFPALASSKRASLSAHDISNLRQLGLAAAMYEEVSASRVFSLPPLYRAGQITESTVSSPLDRTKKGYANAVLDWLMDPSGDKAERRLPFRTSYVSMATFGTKEAGFRQIEDLHPNVGWLVAFDAPSEGKLALDALANSAYFRLRLDTSVCRRPAVGLTELSDGVTLSAPAFVFFDCDLECRRDYITH